MNVLKFTTHDGRAFYNSDCSRATMEETVRKLRDFGRCYQIDMIEMTEQEYNALPATSDSAIVFGPAVGS